MEPENWRSLPEHWEPGTEILMEPQIWQALPRDLLLKILASLPMRVLAQMRTVSRDWRQLLALPDAPQRIDPSFSVHAIPGFLVQLEWIREPIVELPGERIVETCVIDYLGGDSSDMNIYRASLPSDVVIVDACRNIYCSHRRGDSMDLSIGNLATRSRRPLPRPQLPRWRFIAMDVDATRRRCTLVLGESYHICQPDPNTVVIGIYDSQSNAWTMDAMRVQRFVHPSGKGICSKGTVYWIAYMSYTIVTFTIAVRHWAEIAMPQDCGCPWHVKWVQLVGCDGRVALIIYCHRHLCMHMWKLKEEPGAPEWCEPIQIPLPPRIRPHTVGVNSSGWTMLFDGEWGISMCNPERRLRRRITLPIHIPSPYPVRTFVSAFESNNVSWP